MRVKKKTDVRLGEQKFWSGKCVFKQEKGWCGTMPLSEGARDYLEEIKGSPAPWFKSWLVEKKRS